MFVRFQDAPRQVRCCAGFSGVGQGWRCSILGPISEKRQGTTSRAAERAGDAGAMGIEAGRRHRVEGLGCAARTFRQRSGAMGSRIGVSRASRTGRMGVARTDRALSPKRVSSGPRSRSERAETPSRRRPSPSPATASGTQQNACCSRYGCVGSDDRDCGRACRRSCAGAAAWKGDGQTGRTPLQRERGRGPRPRSTWGCSIRRTCQS